MKQATVYELSTDWTPAQREEWMTDAKCAEIGGDAWFPDFKGDKGTEAKRICRTCPVIAQCAEYAIRTNQEIGVWAGMTKHELRRYRAAQRDQQQ